jgi:hypothetical protein
VPPLGVQAKEQPREQPQDQLSPRVAGSVTQGITNAYYPQTIAQAETARSRAQAAFSISSAIATTLVGLGIFSNFRALRGVVQLVGMLALIAWVVTAGLFIRAVAVPVQRKGLRESQTTYDFANSILRNAVAERDEVDRRQGHARIASIIAAILTFATLASATAVRPQPKLTSVEVVVSADAAKMLERVCTNRPSIPRGKVDTKSLSGNFIPVKLDAGVCRKDLVTVTFRKEQVLGIASR